MFSHWLCVCVVRQREVETQSCRRQSASQKTLSEIHFMAETWQPSRHVYHSCLSLRFYLFILLALVLVLIFWRQLLVYIKSLIEILGTSLSCIPFVCWTHNMKDWTQCNLFLASRFQQAHKTLQYYPSIGPVWWHTCLLFTLFLHICCHLC